MLKSEDIPEIEDMPGVVPGELKSAEHTRDDFKKMLKSEDMPEIEDMPGILVVPGEWKGVENTRDDLQKQMKTAPLIAQLKSKAESLVQQAGLQWSDVEPLLEKVSQEELQEALKNPKPFFKKFLAEAGGIVAVKLLLPKLKREFEPLLQQTGLTWDDVEPAFELVDSRAELEEATSNPQVFFKKLLKQDAPVVKKIHQKIRAYLAPLIAQLKSKAESLVQQAGLQWSDVEPMLEKVDSPEELQEALKNPKPFFKKFLAEAGGMIAVKLMLPKLKREFEPFLQSQGLTWEDVEPAFELVDSQAELEEATSNPPEFFKKLLKQGGPSVEKIQQKMKEKAFDAGASLIGEENAAMAKESLEMAQKIKEGKVSAKDMRKFMIKQAQDNPEMAKALLDSFGFSSMKGELDAVKGQLEEGMKEAQAQAEDTLEDAGVDPGLVTMWLRIFKPILVSNIKDLGKQYKHHPELCNEGMGEKLLEECGGWRRLLWVWKKIAQMPPCVCSVCLFLYFVFAVMILPGIALLNDPDNGFPSLPTTVIGKWTPRHYIFFAILAILPVGLFTNVKMIRNNVKLELCGSMMAQLQAHYHPDVEGAGKPVIGTGQPNQMHPVIRAAVRNMRAQSNRNWKFSCFCSAIGVLAVTFHFLVNVYLPTKNPYWLLHAAMFASFVPLTLSSIFAAVVLVISECNLFQRNIEAYQELNDTLYMQVAMVIEKVTAKAAKLKGSLKDAIKNAVTADPMIKVLQDQVRAREEYLTNMAKTLIKGPTCNTVNFLYACMLIGYFLILFWVYVVFLEVNAKKNAKKGDSSAEMIMGVGLIVCTVLSTICILQPLLAMGKQAQAWVKFTNSFKSDARQRVSAALSPKDDPFFLMARFEKMQDHFTWNIVGARMLYSVIATAVASYFAVMWTTVVMPAIQDYADELKQEILAQVNQTMADFQSQINETLAETVVQINQTVTGSQ